MSEQLADVDETVDESEPNEPPRDSSGRFRRPGAPDGNTNRLRHGLSSGQLPAGCGWISTLCNRFRGEIEDAVIAEKGEISLHDAAAINTAVRWERHAQLAQRWLRVDIENMTADQRLAFSRDVARASAERDKCLRALGLDKLGDGDLAGLYDRQAS